jgi:hypothetical protein
MAPRPLEAIKGPLGASKQYPSISRAYQHPKTLRPYLLVILVRFERLFRDVLVILCSCTRVFDFVVCVDVGCSCVCILFLYLTLSCDFDHLYGCERF